MQYPALDAQVKQIWRLHSPKISTAGGKNSTSALAMLAAFCISEFSPKYLFVKRQKFKQATESNKSNRLPTLKWKKLLMNITLRACRDAKSNKHCKRACAIFSPQLC